MLKDFAKYSSEFSCVDYRFTFLLPLFILLTKNKKTNEQNNLKTLLTHSQPGYVVMHQSNRSFNIPLGQPPGHLNFWKFFVEIAPPRAKKLFKCLIIGLFQVIKWPHRIPHPLGAVIKCFAPGKTKMIKFPPPGQEKASNARSMPEGGREDVEASI